jgi:acetyl-CoA acetyltransferase
VSYGLFPPGKFALLATAHTARYGSSREQLGRFVVRNRDRALKWEHGYWYKYRPETLTLDTYMEARMISWPLCLHDCDIPVQMAGAFIVTTADRAAALKNRPAYILGTASPFSLHELLPEPLDDYVAKGRQLARHLWKNAGIRPEDIDVANLYDGFSIHVPLWLEALGFCDEGEGFAFAADPTLPLNTSSGNLGAGRTHGICHILDSVLQVQGRAGERQVEGARISLAITNTCDAGSGIVLASSPN